MNNCCLHFVKARHMQKTNEVISSLCLFDCSVFIWNFLNSVTEGFILEDMFSLDFFDLYVKTS